MNKILCWLGFHNWLCRIMWTPYMEAHNIISVEYQAFCRRCGKIDHCIYNFGVKE